MEVLRGWLAEACSLKHVRRPVRVCVRRGCVCTCARGFTMAAKPPEGDALTEAERSTATKAVVIYMALKVIQDTTTTSVWPLLLKDLYGGDVALATTAAATMSSLCGVVELFVNPIVGNLSDAFGRKAFFFLGPVANVVLSVLQIRFQTSIPMAFAQRVICQSLSTVSGSTIGSAVLSDVVSGNKYSEALGKLASFAGVGVIIGPLLSGALMTRFPEHQHVAVAFGVRVAVSASTVAYLALCLPETLPKSKRRPFSLAGVNPFGFLKLFTTGSATFRKLCVACGCCSMVEGKMTTDTVMVLLRENVGFSSNQVTSYLTSWGVACFFSGQVLVKQLIKVLGPRGFTDFTLCTNIFSNCLLGLVSAPWAVWGHVVSLAPGINNLCGVAMKSQATAHAVAGGMGKGEFSAALSSLRALAFVIAPTCWGRIYSWCTRSGHYPGLALVVAAIIGAALPAAIHRSVGDQVRQISQSVCAVRAPRAPPVFHLSSCIPRPCGPALRPSQLMAYLCTALVAMACAKTRCGQDRLDRAANTISVPRNM
jgi:DHA1 family tetracycline resistance protein-like MFS transporter